MVNMDSYPEQQKKCFAVVRIAKFKKIIFFYFIFASYGLF